MTSGRGITWVLLRGLAREALHWGDFPRQLLQSLPLGDTVMAIDLPGNGVLNDQPSPASVPAMARACRAQLERLAPGKPFVLVAMSLGGMVALEWARAAPPGITGCVLINTSLRSLSPFWQRLRPRQYAMLARLALAGMSASEREDAILGMTSSDPARHATDGVPQRWTQIAQQHPVSPRNALVQLLAAARYAPPRDRPSVPVLVLASAGDALVSSQCSRTIAVQWKLPLHMHPAAGHDLPLDDPAWVIAQAVQWRDSLPLQKP